MDIGAFLENFYKPGYTRMLLLPAVLFPIALIVAFVFPGLTPGIDLTGGNRIVVQSPTPIDGEELQALLEQEFAGELVDLGVQTVSGPGGFGANIQFAFNQTLHKAEERLKEADSLLSSGNEAGARTAYAETINALASYVEPVPPRTDMQELSEQAHTAFDEADRAFEVRLKNAIVQHFNLGEDAAFQRQEIGAVIGELFWQNALTVAVIAMLLITIVVFLLYRELIPSLAIVAAIVFDVAFSLALMAVFSIPLSLATIPALLMLIGYSVDTDIILTTRLFKRKGAELFQNAASCLRTGLTMTTTSLFAVSIMVVLAYLNQMGPVVDIALVLWFGLIGDIVATWYMNAPILMWYVENKRGVR